MTVLKVEESLHELSMENNDFQDGWVLAYLSDVGNARLGKTPRKSNYRDEGIHRIVKFRDVTDKGVAYSESKAAYVVDNPSALKVLRPLSIGDVLVTASAHSGDQIGKKCAYVESLPEIKGGVYFVGELLGITSDPRIMHSKWPYYWFLSEDGFKAVQAAVAGVHLTNGRAQNIPIPIAPVDEQNRIIQKLDELLYSLNVTKDRLTKVSIILKRFRQAVLATACSGRLTADWRSTPKEFEPADQLVERIRRTYREQYEAECNKTKREGKRLPKKPEILELRKVKTADLPEIPDEWTWIYLAALGFMSRGKSKYRPRNAPHLSGGPYPFIQTGDIAQSQGLITSHRQTYSEAGLAQSHLWPAGTICITIAANIANSAILTYPACFPDSVVGLISYETLCLKEYAEFFIRTARANLDQFAPATAQKNINIEILRDVAVPLPPLTEQKEIVRRVESLFKLADAIEKRVAFATARAKKLTQAILAKAFRGELVPTEAELARREGRSYETASELLARIKSDKEINEISVKLHHKLDHKKRSKPR